MSDPTSAASAEDALRATREASRALLDALAGDGDPLDRAGRLAAAFSVLDEHLCAAGFPGGRQAQRASPASRAATGQAPPAADPDAQLRRIRRNCEAIRRRIPQLFWDLAVIEVTASMALDRGHRRADGGVICGRLQDLTNCAAGLSRDLQVMAGDAVGL